MKVINILKIFFIIATASILIACGGGSSSTSGNTNTKLPKTSKAYNQPIIKNMIQKNDNYSKALGR